MDSIVQHTKSCAICGSLDNLQKHHIYHGANRKVSDDNGFWCWLCLYHHTGSNVAVHGRNGRLNDLMLKKRCQKAYELDHSREEFMSLIGKNYL